MYICAFNFDINWFTTLPGLLISGGVILLFLSLLLFTTSSRKNKGKTKKEEVVVPTNVAPNFNDSMMNTEVNMNSQMANDNMPPIHSVDPVIQQTIEPQVQNDAFSVNPVQVEPVVDTNMNQGNMDIPTSIEPVVQEVSPVNEENVIPVNPVIEDSIAPVNMEQSFVNVEEVPTPIQNTVVEPELPTQSVVDIPVVNTVDVEAPIVSDVTEAISMNEIPKVENTQVYGGVNPLDKTQTIPVINSVVEQPSVEPMEQEPKQPDVSEQPVYQEAKIVEDKDIEVLDF